MLWPCGRRARAAPAATVTCPRSACPLPRLCSCLCCSSCFRSGGSLGGPSNNNNNNNIWPHYLRLDNYALPGTRAHTRSQVRCPVNDDAAPHVDCGTRNVGTARGQSRSSAVATDDPRRHSRREQRWRSVPGRVPRLWVAIHVVVVVVEVARIQLNRAVSSTRLSRLLRARILAPAKCGALV